MMQMDWVGVGVPHPHWDTTSLDGSNGSSHLNLSTLQVWLHCDPTILSIASSWDFSPDQGFAVGRDGEGLPASYPSCVYTLLLPTNAMDAAAVSEDVIPLSIPWRMSMLRRLTCLVMEEVLPAGRDDIHTSSSHWNLEVVGLGARCPRVPSELALPRWWWTTGAPPTQLLQKSSGQLRHLGFYILHDFGV